MGWLREAPGRCIVKQQTHKRFNVFSDMLSHCALSCLMRVFRDFVSVRRSGKDMGVVGEFFHYLYLMNFLHFLQELKTYVDFNYDGFACHEPYDKLVINKTVIE